MREFVIRTIVAAVGVPLLLIIAVRGSWPLIALVAALQILILFEWNALCRVSNLYPNLLLLIFAVVALDFAIGSLSLLMGTAILIPMAIILYLAELFRADRQPLRNLAGAALFLMYVALPLALWLKFKDIQSSARFAPSGPLAVAFIATWVCDTAAYILGRAFGRHKLYTAASPKKTVEGFIAGLLFAIPILPLMNGLGWTHASIYDFAVLPIIVGVAGQLGDLLESLMKREGQLKDTSKLLPGHGGILDRFDSLIISTPLLFAYLVFTTP